MSVERKIVEFKIKDDFIPKLQTLQDKGLLIELLCSSSWSKIESEWIKHPATVHVELDNLAEDLAMGFNKIGEAADKQIEDQETLRKHGPLANHIPDSLLVRRNENPHVISDAGVAHGLSKFGLEKVVEGRIEMFTTRKVPGSGKLILSGFSEEKSSSQGLIVHTLLRSVSNIQYGEFTTWDLHLHSEGSQGPSAGLAMFASLMSAWTGKILPADIAFTGELLLTGKLKPIGGLPGKLIGAYRGYVKTIILPKGNECDIKQLPKIFQENMTFRPVEAVDEIMDLF